MSKNKKKTPWPQISRIKQKMSDCNSSNLIELDDNSIIGKIVAIFPLVFFLVALGHGIKNQSYVLMAIALLFLVIGVWTLFARGKILFDKHNREIIRYKKWLWLEWTKRAPIHDYEYVNIISFSGEGNAKGTYAVNIKHRNSSFLAVDDIRLKVFSHNNREAAFNNAEEVALILGLEFVGKT